MIQEFTSQPLLAAWPFWILEIDPSADNRGIEKAYQKIVSSLQLKIPNAEIFSSPLGNRIRDEYALREAKAILTNPEQRILAEFWYLPPNISIAENLPADELSQVDWKKVIGSI